MDRNILIILGLGQMKIILNFGLFTKYLISNTNKKMNKDIGLRNPFRFEINNGQLSTINTGLEKLYSYGPF